MTDIGSCVDDIKPGDRVVVFWGAHTFARPKMESSASLWTDRDDLKTALNLTKGKRLNLKSMICEIYSPEDAAEIYSRIISEKSFSIGVLFDWSEIQ